MSFRLKEGVFKVRCREPGCAFASEFVVKENIMGATELDVDTEALRIARNLGYIKHDALYGRFHPLANPEITKISGSYERLGTSFEAPSAPPAETPWAVPTAAPPAPPAATTSVHVDSGETRPADVKKPAPRKTVHVVAKKAKKAAPTKKKPLTKKKPSAKKKIVTKKKATARKKTVAKKRPVARKRSVPMKKPAAKKQAAATKKPASKKTSARKR